MQRSRDPNVRGIPEANLQQLVAGATLESLHKQYQSGVQDSDGAFSLGLMASAMKTIVITEHVWGDELRQQQALSIASRVLPETSSAKSIPELYSQETQLLLAAKELAPSPAFDRSSVRGFRMLGGADQLVGLVVHTPFDLDDHKRDLYWVNR